MPLLLLFVTGVAAQTRPPDVPDSYAQVAENETFTLWFDSTTLAFKVVDGRSGFVWHSGVDAPLDDDQLNRSWQAFALSGVSIEVLDERGTNRRVSLTNSEHTLTVTPIADGVRADVTFVEQDISLSLLVQLQADGVVVGIPFDSIREGAAGFRLGEVYPYPFLGAARGSTIPGYLLLPDGTGSIIPFADSTRADNMIYWRYYGADLGILSEAPYDERVSVPDPVAYPVYGVVHSAAQSAYLAVIESGAGYAELHAHPAGVITNFNFAYPAFIYSETYFQATNRSGAGVTAIQRQPNAFDAVVRYRFVTGDAADYVGLAHSYRDSLTERGLLRPVEVTNPDIPIRLDFLGGDRELLSLSTPYVPMTTIAQMGDILADLSLPNVDVVYYGWQASGATSLTPTGLAVEGALGSAAELRALAETVTDAGGAFAVYADPQGALIEQPGYSARNDLAMSITNQNLASYNTYPTHYFTREVLTNRLNALMTDTARHAPIGLALDGIGFTLYTDYRHNPPFSREAAITAYQAMLSDAPLRVAMYRPNAYLLGAADAFYDMPLGGNGYIYTSASVPFLPIALSGIMPYHGTALNFASNRQNDLLRHAEYGIYPSYYVTQAPTSAMLNTPSAWIYTSSYAQWGEPIRESYAWLNGLLAPVRGQAITAHARLDRDVYMTTYANGHRIAVNYGDAPFSGDGFTIGARDAVLLEGGS